MDRTEHYQSFYNRLFLPCLPGFCTAFLHETIHHPRHYSRRCRQDFGWLSTPEAEPASRAHCEGRSRAITGRRTGLPWLQLNGESSVVFLQREKAFDLVASVLDPAPDTAAVTFETDADRIMERLCSPAPESFRVIDDAVCLRRAQAEKDERSDDTPPHTMLLAQLKQDLEALSYLAKPGYDIIVVSLANDSKGQNQMEEIHWDVVPSNRTSLNDSLSARGSDDRRRLDTTVLDLAHEALDLVTDAALAPSSSRIYDDGRLVDCAELDAIVKQAERRLELTDGTDLRGRKSGDAALCFALAGVDQSSSLFRGLLSAASKELRRAGFRSSYKARNILQMVEKFAAAGCCGVGPVDKEEASSSLDLFRLAAECLRTKGFHDGDHVVDSLTLGKFHLHTSRAVLWLWRFSARQPKLSPGTFVVHSDFKGVHRNRTSAVHGEHEQSWGKGRGRWSELFDDPRMPLVIDVGSGMGVSILELATHDENDYDGESNDDYFSVFCNFKWSECNFLGCDLNSAFVGYANGIASRWGIEGRVRFVQCAAESLLDWIGGNGGRGYPGKVELIMIQFPTPFRLSSAIGRNSPLASTGRGGNKLPSKLSLDDSSRRDLDFGFMVSKNLLRSIRDILKGRAKVEATGNSGRLLIQSNCEDVAVAIRKVAVEQGFIVLEVPQKVLNSGNTTFSSSSVNALWGITRRTKNWLLSSREQQERAEGFGWSQTPLLPQWGASETEVACRFKCCPMHRCILHPG